MLFIVGSGLGNPELLTVKAYRVLKKAEILLFDNLVSEEILNIVPKNCQKVYVGKQPYGKCVSQDEINPLIVDYCSRYSVVVRLKGGDPYIFGRGFEEWCYAEESGIAVEYIPGISSMQGAGLCKIPLTHRGVSEGVWVMTGTKSDGEMAMDLSLAAQSNATVVIYMGMRKLAEIVRIYMLYGNGDKPAAIIQYASRPQQKEVTCRVRDLVGASQMAGASHPAIIIIGEVVSLRSSLRTVLSCFTP